MACCPFTSAHYAVVPTRVRNTSPPAGSPGRRSGSSLLKILITGICGFVGAALARQLVESSDAVEICGIDNLSRPGSYLNRAKLAAAGCQVFHGDIRNASDVDALPPADWVIDAAAIPSVLAGADGTFSSRQLVENNLSGTINLLEYCKRHSAGFILLSTSRVYSIEALCNLPLQLKDGAFAFAAGDREAAGASALGISERFSAAPPVSLYGCSKLASELLALEYGALFAFPVWINRCGVLAGAGQFGRADQGIFSYWIHSWRARQPLSYIGFDGRGPQVRDALHPHDLLPLLRKQMAHRGSAATRIFNIGGGSSNACSLAALSRWCEARFGPHEVAADRRARPFDVPWVVIDSSLALGTWGWRPEISLEQMLEEIAAHAEANPDWLRLTS